MSSLSAKAVEVFKEIVSRRRRLDREAVEPYDYQLEAFREFERLANGDLSVLIIRAPPARGKTEAAVAPFLAQFVSGEVLLPRIIYATPTQTLLYSMVRRFEGYLEALSQAYGSFAAWREKLSPVAEHGLDVDPQYLVPRFTVSTYDVVAYAWTARRTIPWRPFTTRGALISSLVVFDEAHLVQDSFTYSQRVFVKLVETMAESGVPAVVMSATLPSRFVEELKNSLDGRVREVVDGNAEIPGEISVTPVNGDTTDFKTALAEVIDVVKNAVKNCKDVLLVFNTVRVAVEAYNSLLTELKREPYTVVEVRDWSDVERALKDGGKSRVVFLVLVHGRLPIGVRRRREELFEKLREIRSKMKKDEKKDLEKRWSLVVVATQVAEVGLDYSFDYVVTELAPPSALVQRIMRAGRIRGQRSEALVLPPIVLDPGSKSVPLSYFVYTRKMLDLGKGFAKELSNDPTKIADVRYVGSWVDREFEALESETKEWVESLVERARQVLEASRFVPPLAAAAHRRVLEMFRFRLGEYVALCIVDEGASDLEKAASTEEFRLRLHELIAKTGGDLQRKLVEGSIRYTIRFRKAEIGGDKHVIATLPRECVWAVGGKHVVPYVRSMRRDGVEINSLELRRLDKGGEVYEAPGAESIYGRILICKHVPGFRPEMGLVEVEEVGLVVR